jgi:DNA-binding GntR family transcriptional regulator
MQTWQVSKATAGKATDLLKSRGLVETVPAKGLRVISPEHEHPAAPEPAPAAAKRTRAVRLPPDKRTRLKASDPAESAQVEPRPGLGPKRIGEQSD